MRVMLHKLYGIHPELEAKLKACSIRDSEDLLRAYRAHGSINGLAEHVGIEAKVAAQLVHRADLARIRGIGEAYTSLLEAVGIRSLQDLANRSPEELRSEFETINNERRLVGRVPALAMVNGWVSKARRLPVTVN